MLVKGATEVKTKDWHEGKFVVMAIFIYNTSLFFRLLTSDICFGPRQGLDINLTGNPKSSDNNTLSGTQGTLPLLENKSVNLDSQSQRGLGGKFDFELIVAAQGLSYFERSLARCQWRCPPRLHMAQFPKFLMHASWHNWQGSDYFMGIKTKDFAMPFLEKLSNEENCRSQLFRKVHSIELNDLCTLEKTNKIWLPKHTGCLQDRPYNIWYMYIHLSICKK